MRHLKSIFSILVYRAAPGLINLASLLTLARLVSVEKYGIYSVMMATGNFLSSALFGTLIFSVVSKYAPFERSGLLKAFIGNNTVLFLPLAAGVLLLGWVGSQLFGYPYAPVPMAVALSMHAILQELTRAALRIRLYALSDLIQAVLFLVFIHAFVSAATPVSDIALLFTASYVFAALLNIAVFFRMLAPRFDLAISKEVLHMGGWLVVGNFSETALTLGARYLMLGLGERVILGQFSLAVDIAQRTIGFMVNAMSFLFVPRAFAAEQDGDEGAFRREILRGGAAAIALGALVTVGLIGSTLLPLRWLDPIRAHPLVFALVAAAVVTTRLRKLIVDPFAMKHKRIYYLVFANLLGAGVGLALIYGLLRVHIGLGAAIGYLSGWLVIFTFGAAPFAAEILGFKTRPAPLPLGEKAS
ncbi:MAG: lipopolysaccharide biosynthesis protein [Parcubacteria group bacterium]